MAINLIFGVICQIQTVKKFASLALLCFSLYVCSAQKVQWIKASSQGFVPVFPGQFKIDHEGFIICYGMVDSAMAITKYDRCLNQVWQRFATSFDGADAPGRISSLTGIDYIDINNNIYTRTSSNIIKLGPDGHTIWSRPVDGTIYGNLGIDGKGDLLFLWESAVNRSDRSTTEITQDNQEIWTSHYAGENVVPAPDATLYSHLVQWSSNSTTDVLRHFDKNGVFIDSIAMVHFEAYNWSPFAWGFYDSSRIAFMIDVVDESCVSCGSFQQIYLYGGLYDTYFSGAFLGHVWSLEMTKYKEALLYNSAGLIKLTRSNVSHIQNISPEGFNDIPIDTAYDQTPFLLWRGIDGSDSIYKYMLINQKGKYLWKKEMPELENRNISYVYDCAFDENGDVVCVLGKRNNYQRDSFFLVRIGVDTCWQPIDTFHFDACGVFPNPSTGVVSFYCPQVDTGSSHLTIYDYTGRLIDESDHHIDENYNTTFSYTLPAARQIYIYRLTTPKHVYTGRIERL